MRIALTGVHSSGKSTLIEALATEPMFADYTVCPEVTRQLRSFVKINEEGSDATQVLVINQHVTNVTLFEKMLVDRCIIDGVLYTFYLFSSGRVSRDVMNYAIHAYNKIIDRYDHIFYLEPLPLRNDGVRSVNSEFYNKMKENFTMFLASNGKLPVEGCDSPRKLTRLPAVSIADRVQLIKSVTTPKVK